MSDDVTGRQMVVAARKAPYLQRQEEHELAVRWKDSQDQDALHRITIAHMRLVIAMAGKFRGFGLPASDLIQEGHVGLLEAAARFDPGRDVRFSTYATWWIRASMQDYILRNWSIVRGGTSSAQKSLFFNLRRLRAKLSYGVNPPNSNEIHDTIAHELGISKADVALMDSRLSGGDVSLNMTVGTDDEAGAERMEFLPADGPLPDELASASIDGERHIKWIRSALNVLNDRELFIVRRRRLSEEGATLETLGSRLGISKERVRQIEHKAMEKLQDALVAAHPELAQFNGNSG